MDEKRTDLRAALRDLAAEKSGDNRPHAGLKRLIAYRRGTLPAAEREALQEHLSRCPRCTGLLLELRDFEAASSRGNAAGPESLPQEAWESLAQRLPMRGSAIRPISSAARHQPTPRRRIPPFVAGLAAALLLVVIGLSGWLPGMVQLESADGEAGREESRRLARLEQQLKEREKALAAARHSLAEVERQLVMERKKPVEPAGRVNELEARVAELTSALEELRRTIKTPAQDRIAAASPPIAVSAAPLFSLRGQEPTESGFLRGDGTVNSVPMQGDRIGVKLNLTDHPVYGEYRIELSDREGQVLWTGRRPNGSLLGDAGTTVSVTGLGPGRYTLRIEGLRPDRTDLLAAYLLEVARTGEPARD